MEGIIPALSIPIRKDVTIQAMGLPLNYAQWNETNIMVESSMCVWGVSNQNSSTMFFDIEKTGAINIREGSGLMDVKVENNRIYLYPKTTAGRSMSVVIYT